MKRFLAIVLSLLLIAAAGAGANAAVTDIIDSGDKTVITDADWAYEKVRVYGWELDEYIGTSTEPELPWTFGKEIVSTVGDYAFNNNTSVTSVKTTGVLEAIGEYAFNGCTDLLTITLYDALTDLGVGCFYGCASLTDINLGDTSITAVPAYCFAGCGFSNLTLPDTCLSIGNMAFYNCSQLKKLLIPDSVTEIDENAFSGCDHLTVFCKADSYAHEYAVANDIPFILINASSEVTFILGDTDGDGIVTVLDATKIQRVLVDLDSDDDGMIALRGDVNDEGKLNILHATKIQRYLADFIIEEPIGTEVTRTITI